MNNKSKGEKHIEKTEECLRKEIDQFLCEYLPPFDREKAKTDPKVVHDGLWGTVKLRPIEICFIDTPLVQRLRQVHQMGWSNLTYPSTTHNRFEHTIGVMRQVQKLGDALLKQPEERRLDESQINEMRLAALFHDLGHGPFSHTSEEIYTNSPEIDCLKVKYSTNAHEILTYLIVTSESFRQFCKNASDIYQENIPVDEIANYIIGKCTQPPKPFKRELLYGPFDSDKLDYLFRDSHFSGIPLAVDLQRLLYTIRIHSAKDELRLVVTRSGATSLEQILFSKMVLFTTVYHHQKVRACDCMFAGIIEYMREKDIYMKLGDRTLKWNSPIDYLWITDGEFLSFGFETTDKNLRKLIQDLYFRRLSKRALILSRNTVKITDDSKWDELQKHAKEKPESARIRRELAKAIWKKAGKPCLLQEVWLDLPELPNMKVADETFVLPAEGPEIEPVTLNQIFPTGQWTKQYGMNRWRGHVFCPPYLCESIGKAAKEVLEERFNIEILPEAFLWCKVKPPERNRVFVKSNVNS